MDIKDEKAIVWPLMDKYIEYLKFVYFTKEHMDKIDEALYSDNDIFIKDFVKMYEAIFKDAISLNEQQLYLYILWTDYKAKINNVNKEKLDKIKKMFKYLQRYYIPINLGKTIEFINETPLFFSVELYFYDEKSNERDFYRIPN